MIKNKFLSSLIMCFLLLFSFSTNTYASEKVVGIDDNYVFDSNYGFSFNKTSSSNSYQNLTRMTTEFQDSPSKVLYGIHINSSNNNLKGKIYYQWNNVGSYNGTQINLRVTVMDWGYITNNGTAGIAFDEFTPGYVFQTGAIESPLYRFSFLDNNGNSIHLKGHGTMIDIDSYQAVWYGSGVSKAFYKASASGGVLYSDGDWVKSDNVSTTLTDKRSWSTFYYDGEYVDIRFCQTTNADVTQYPNDTTISDVAKGAAFF